MPQSDITPEYTMDVLVGQTVPVEYFNSWYRDVAYLKAGYIDEQAVSVFTRGQCHALALELHRATGWELCGLFHENDTDSYYGSGTPSHVVVRDPEGYVIDIGGIDADTRFCEDQNFEVVALDVFSVLSYDQIDYTIPALGIAKAFVPAVLAQVEKQKETTNAR